MRLVIGYDNIISYQNDMSKSELFISQLISHFNLTGIK